MTVAKRVLVVDDDSDLRGVLCEQLAMYGEFVAEPAETAAAALERADSGDFDAILMEIGLPDMDGRDACRLLRRKGVTVPILMVTKAAGDADVILGLDAGANDYVVKPVRLGVLLARLRAQMRQYAQNDDAVFRIGPYNFRSRARVLFDRERGRTAHLTEIEAAILKQLYRASNTVVSREELLREVWGYEADAATHTLETHVYRLRRKMKLDQGESQLLLTQPGGYRLVV